MVLARQKGRSGETYILSGERVTVKDLMRMFEEITGVKAPSYRSPRGWRVPPALLPHYTIS